MHTFHNLSELVQSKYDFPQYHRNWPPTGSGSCLPSSPVRASTHTTCSLNKKPLTTHANILSYCKLSTS